MKQKITQVLNRLAKMVVTKRFWTDVLAKVIVGLTIGIVLHFIR